MDLFENFEGFRPEWHYDSFRREGLISTTREILKTFAGESIELGYDSVRPNGVVTIYRNITVSKDPAATDRLLRGVKTEQIRIRPNSLENSNYYLLQRIVIGNQEITQIER